MASVAELDEKQLEALEEMRATFATADGSGMPMEDSTYLRYLRARYNVHQENISVFYISFLQIIQN
jgi:hypothetical protein